MGEPASMRLTTAPVKAPPTSVWFVATDWMSCGPLIVAPTHFSVTTLK